MEKNKEKIKLLELIASVQDALLGEIYPSVRRIDVGCKNNCLKIIVYLDREPNEEDFENLAVITTEICADFPSIVDVEEICKKHNGSFSGLTRLDFTAYQRKEE